MGFTWYLSLLEVIAAAVRIRFGTGSDEGFGFCCVAMWRRGYKWNSTTLRGSPCAQVTRTKDRGEVDVIVLKQVKLVVAVHVVILGFNAKYVLMNDSAQASMSTGLAFPDCSKGT